MIKIAIIQGGPKTGYKKSILSGSLMFSLLTDPDNEFSKNYQVINIFIDKNNNWFYGKHILYPKNLTSLTDIAIVCINERLASYFKVKESLKRNNIPYVGSDPSSTFLAYNKNISKNVLIKNKINTPKSIYIKRNSKNNFSKKSIQVERRLNLPCIGKPVNSNMSEGVEILNSKDEICSFIKRSFSKRALEGLLFEEFIKGREVRVTLIENFKHKKMLILPPLEIILPNGRFFDAELKKAGNNKISCPATFTKEEMKKLEAATKKIHKAFKFKNYSRAEFIVDQKHEVYAIDLINTIPKMSDDSLLSINLSAINSNLKEFLNHLILSELKNYKHK